MTLVSPNLNRSPFVINRDGIFDDFFNSTITNANFTENTFGTGAAWIQNEGAGELTLEQSGAQARRVKYQNTSALAFINTYPFPTYADILLETRVTIENGNINMAGFRINYGTWSFSFNQLWGGLFYDGAASALNGIEIMGDGSTTQYTSLDLTLGNSYLLKITLNFDYMINSEYRINVWVDGTQYVTDYTIDRSVFTGHRLETNVGIMADIPNGGGKIIFDYWSCNRMDTLTVCQYQNSLLHKIPTLLLKFYDKDSQVFQQMGAESVINVYARNRAIMEGFTGDSLADALLMRLDMNGNATDRTGNYDGTVTGATFVDYKRFRNVIQFDGTGDYVDIPDIDVDWAGRGFTIAGWVVFDAASGSSDRILHLSTTGNNYGIVLVRGTAADSFTVIIYSSIGVSIGTITDADFFTTGTAAHFIFTMDAAGAMTLYKNNVSAATGSGTLPPAGNRTGNRIGANAAGTEDMNGRQWELCIWLRVINDDEREFVYEAIKFQHRFSGRLTRSLPATKKDKFIRTRIKSYEGIHISSIVSNRVFTGSFASQTADYILKDGTNGVYTLKASEVDTTNVDTGNYSLTHNFVQETLQTITLLVAADEDFVPRIDNDFKLYFNPIGDTSTRLFEIIEGDFKLTDYEFMDISDLQYNRVEVHGSQLWEVTKNEMGNKDPLGERTKVIVDPTITTQSEAQRIARKALVSGKPLRIGTLMISRNYFYQAGDIVQLTIDDTRLGIDKKQFIIVELAEDIFNKTQIATIAENSKELSDFIYEIFKSTSTLDKTNMDASAAIYTTVFIDVAIEVEIRCLVEESSNGTDYTNHYEGKAMVTNRAITVLSACGWTEPNTPRYDILVTNGVDFQIGTGSQPPKPSNTTLNNHLTALDKNLSSVTGGVVKSKTNENWQTAGTVIWDNTQANGYTITESGYAVQWLTPTAGTPSDNNYGTVSKWAPYNDPVNQIMAHAVFPEFVKTSSKWLRITFTCRIYTGSRKSSSDI